MKLQGFPMFGTCAGCIMMAKSIDGMPDQRTLDLSDISVCRNAYGSQVHSFEASITGDAEVFGNEPVNAVLIRAPMITRVSYPSPHNSSFPLFSVYFYSDEMRGDLRV
jgi:5'-phosphate synthase pdxT subunit